MAERLIQGKIIGGSPFKRLNNELNRAVLFINEGPGSNNLIIGFPPRECPITGKDRLTSRVDSLQENPHLIPEKLQMSLNIINEIVLDINSTTCSTCPLQNRCTLYKPELSLENSGEQSE